MHQLLLVANRRARGVDIVWIGGRRISYTIPVEGAPTALAANRAGTRLYVAVAGSAAAFCDLIRSDTVRLGQVVKASGATVD